MMQASIFCLPDSQMISGSQNIGLHHGSLKLLRFLDTAQVPTALTREILEIKGIDYANHYVLISESQNIGLHHKFLKFLKIFDKPRSPTAFAREILEI